MHTPAQRSAIVSSDHQSHEHACSEVVENKLGHAQVLNSHARHKHAHSPLATGDRLPIPVYDGLMKPARSMLPAVSRLG